MAVAGIDIRALVKGAADMAAELKGCRDITQSAYRYAMARNLYYNEGYRMEMLASFEPQLHWSINGGSSYLRRVKAKKIRDFIRSVVNTQRNCTLSDSSFRMAAL